MSSEAMKFDLSNHLLLKFNHKADVHEEWSKDKDQLLKSQDFRNCSVNEVKELTKKHQIFVLELASHQTQVKQIASISDELKFLRYDDYNSVQMRCKRICDEWNQLVILTHQRSVAIKEAEQVFEKIDSLHLEFAKIAVPFNNWLDGASQDLMDVYIVHFIKEMQDLVDACQQFKMKLLEADKKHFSIVSLSQEIESIATQYQICSAAENPYTCLKTKDISNKWFEVKQLLPKRDQSLQKLHLKEQINENLCRIFTEKANIVGPWIDRQIYSVVTIAMEGNATLEEQLSKLSEHQMAIKLYRPHMDELEVIHKELRKDFMVTENRYTHYTMELLCNGWLELISLIHINTNEVEILMMVRDTNNIPTDHLNRFRVCFNQMDERRIGRLTTDKFKSCLLSLGYNFIDNNQILGQNYERVIKEVDPNNTGFVAFDAFLEFVIKENNYCLQQIIESFRILSSNKLYITVEDLRHRLNPDEAEYCIKRMQSYNGPDAVTGALDYVSFSKLLYEKELSLKRQNDISPNF